MAPLHGCAIHLNDDDRRWLASVLAHDLDLCAELTLTLEALPDDAARRHVISEFVRDARPAEAYAAPARRAK